MFGFSNTILCLIIYTSIFFISLKIILKRIDTYLDPGLIFIFINFLSLLPALIGACFGIVLVPPYWRIFQPEELLVVSEYTVTFIFAFTLFYIFLKPKNTNTSSIKISKIHFSNLWFIVYAFIWAINYTGLKMGLNNYVMAVVGNAEPIAKIIVFGVLLSKIKNKFYVYVASVVFFLFTLFILSPTIENGAYIVNKGNAFLLTLGAIAYVDRVKWKGNLLSRRMLIVAFPFAMFFLALANFIEFLIAGGSSNLLTLLFYFAQGFEPRQMENASTVINWVDTGQESLRYGKTYLNSIIELIYPFSEHISLSRWFVIKELGPEYDGKVGMAFSAIAEGYLNFGYYGLFFAAFYCSCIASIIRYFYSSERFWIIGPFLYANTLRITYYLYRADSQAVLKRIEYSLVIFIGLFFFYLFIRHIGRVLTRAKIHSHGFQV